MLVLLVIYIVINLIASLLSIFGSVMSLGERGSDGARVFVAIMSLLMMVFSIVLLCLLVSSSHSP